MNLGIRVRITTSILLVFVAAALHAQTGGGEPASKVHGRAVTMAAGINFSGSFSYGVGGGSALLKADTVTNPNGSASGPLRFSLYWTPNAAYPSSPSYNTAQYVITPSLAANSSISNINSGSVPFTDPGNGCYYVALVLEEQVSGVWTQRDYGNFSLRISSGQGCLFSFTATPGTIAPGGSSNLAWNSGGTSVTINQGIGTKPPVSNQSVTPPSTITYTLTVNGTADSTPRTGNATVTVSAPPPTVSSITPNHGPMAGGTSVTIGGTNLTGVTSVSFGGTNGTLGTNTATSINVTAPAHAAGVVVVTVTNPAGAATTSYTYDAPNSPAITSIAPNHGSANGGTSLTFTGTNLSGASSVAFGSTNGTITANTATSISVTTPAHAAGQVVVKVTTPTGSASTPFTYDSADTSELLPVVGSVPGNFGSFFRTSLQLTNPTTQTLTGKLVFHPQGQTPSPSDPSLDYSVAPGETKFYSDILPAMSSSGLGSLDLQPSNGTPAPLALVRIFNDGGTAGTTGMTIGFTASGGALKSGDTAVLLAPPSSDGFRFNLGVRALGDGVAMTALVRDSSGTQKRSVPLTFGANTFTQTSASNLIGDLAANDSISFSITAGSALLYGSTTDNTTQDPSYQSAKRVPILATSTAVIPVAGSLPGNFGSFFRTAMQLFNPLSSTMRVQIVFHSQGQNGADTDPSIQVTLAPGETKYYADILVTLGLSGLGSLDLVPLDGALPLVVTRIYNDGGSKGTTGMTLDALLSDDALQAGDTAVLIAPSNANDFRYNLGIRTLANGVSMQLTLRDSTGAIKKSTAVSYGANYFIQVKAGDLIGADVAANDSITISIDSGAAVIYGATTDNRTQDPSAQVAVAQ